MIFRGRREWIPSEKGGNPWTIGAWPGSIGYSIPVRKNLWNPPVGFRSSWHKVGMVEHHSKSDLGKLPGKDWSGGGYC
jgi:hypothetical protein